MYSLSPTIRIMGLRLDCDRTGGYAYKYNISVLKVRAGVGWPYGGDSFTQTCSVCFV